MGVDDVGFMGDVEEGVDGMGNDLGTGDGMRLGDVIGFDSIGVFKSDDEGDVGVVVDVMVDVGSESVAGMGDGVGTGIGDLVGMGDLVGWVGLGDLGGGGVVLMVGVD